MKKVDPSKGHHTLQQFGKQTEDNVDLVFNLLLDSFDRSPDIEEVKDKNFDWER